MAQPTGQSIIPACVVISDAIFTIGMRHLTLSYPDQIKQLGAMVLINIFTNALQFSGSKIDLTDFQQKKFKAWVIASSILPLSSTLGLASAFLTQLDPSNQGVLEILFGLVTLINVAGIVSKWGIYYIYHPTSCGERGLIERRLVEI